MPNFGPRISCLAGCVSDYYNSPLFGPRFSDSAVMGTGVPWGIEAANFSPFIWARINNGQNTITVGNNSYKANPNKAAIKSIEFGFKTANLGRLEVIDEEGGALGIFLDSMTKCVTNQNFYTGIEYMVGWVHAGCEGEAANPISYSPMIKSEILKIDSNISNGIMRFVIHFSTGQEKVQISRNDEIFGEEEIGKDIYLEEAIKKLCTEKDPKINVKFAKKNQSGKIVYVDSFNWVNHGKKGPRAVWKGDSQNKFSTIAKWLESYRIDDGKNGKGIMMLHDPAVPENLILLEDPVPDIGEKENGQSIGTFIVNGGRCSSVLEFNPTVNIIGAKAGLGSGGSTSALSSNPVKKEDVKSSFIENGNKNLGPQETVIPTDSVIWSDFKQASRETNKSQEAHSKANRSFQMELGGVQAPITAELRVVGMTNPSFYSFEINSRTVSIVVISPNYIEKNENCGDFLVRTNCHPFYSNKEWRIFGVNHTVQDGAFVTTLTVQLATPGVDIPFSERLGANDSGILLKNGC